MKMATVFNINFLLIIFINETIRKGVNVPRVKPSQVALIEFSFLVIR